jgi:hypothetical protein
VNMNVVNISTKVRIQDTWLLSILAAFTALDLELKFLIMIK